MGLAIAARLYEIDVVQLIVVGTANLAPSVDRIFRLLLTV